MFNPPNGPVYTAAFATTALSTAGPHDLFVLTSTGNARVVLLDIEVCQTSSAPTVPQGLGLRLWRGSTGIGGGAAITPVHVHGWPGVPAAVSGVVANSS